MAFYRANLGGGQVTASRYIAVECPNGYLPTEWRDDYNAHPNAFFPMANCSATMTISQSAQITVPCPVIVFNGLSATTAPAMLVQFNTSTYQIVLYIPPATIDTANLVGSDGVYYGITNLYATPSTANIKYWMIIDTEIINGRASGVSTMDLPIDGFPVDDYTTTVNPPTEPIALKPTYAEPKAIV